MLKLKLGALLLLLLIIHQSKANNDDIYSSPNFKKATANVTTEAEWKKVNETLDYIHYLMANETEKMTKFTGYGDVLINAQKNLSYLDTVPVYYRWVKHSHLELCLPDFFNNTSITQLSDYNKTFVDKYLHFQEILKTIPMNIDLDLKQIEKYMYYVLDEEIHVEVAIDTLHFYRHLQCNDFQNGPFNDMWLNNITDLYRVNMYWKKREEQQSGSVVNIIKWIVISITCFIFLFAVYKVVKACCCSD
ncbi:unnamed protein product [Caenorhabditis brenneri]